MTHQTSPKPANAYTQARIERAIERARDMRYHAHYLGTHPETGARVYSVRSVSHPDGDRYLVYVTAEAQRGAFRYGRAGWWIRCTCPAGEEFRRPCKHGARVAMRLDREHRATMTRALQNVRSRGGELFEEDEQRGPAGGATFTAREAGLQPGGVGRLGKLEDYFAA